MINPFQLNNIPYHKRFNLPEASGIYYVLNFKTRSILYIGRAKNIRKRWTGHHRKEDLSMLIDEYGSYLISIAWEIRPEQGLEKVESRRIGAFEPLLNGKKLEESVEILIQECAKSEKYTGSAT